MVMANKVKKVIFFNSPSEVDGYLAYNTKSFKIDRLDCLFIAMNPVVGCYLEQKGISGQDTCLYFTNVSHEKALERSKIIMDWLKEEPTFLDLGLGIKRAYKDLFILFTRCPVHYCLWAIEVILNAIDINNPQVVCASYSGRRDVLSFFIEPEEKYLGYLVKLIAKVKKLRFENIPERHSYNLSILRYIGNYVQAFAKFIIKTGKFKLWQKKILKNISFNSKAILFTSRLYQMDKLIGEIQNKFGNKLIFSLELPVVASFNMPNFFVKLLEKKHSNVLIKQKMLLKDLEKTVRAKTAIFSYRDVSFADIISQKVHDNIANYIMGLYIWSVGLDKFIDKANPSVIVSNGGRLDDVILAELCNRRNIPTVLISHGSHVRPKNKYEYIEWRENNRALLEGPFSHIALQSPLTEEYFKTFPTESSVIRTGPLIWGRPVDRGKSELLFKKFFGLKYKFKDVKIILHAGTPKETKALRLYVYETPDEYIRSLCDLASAVDKIPNAVLIIKFRPSAELDVKSLRRLMPFSEKVLLSCEEPFIDLLGMSDLLVSFSSTTIEEALQNRIPVLLYGGGGRYQHIPAYEINSGNSIYPSAIYYVRGAPDLGKAISKILDLNIGGSEEGRLFEPYIYAQDIRTSLVDLLKLET